MRGSEKSIKLTHQNVTAAELPQEIVMDIFVRLPVKTLQRLRCVCKSWLSLINNPYFARKHLNRVTSAYANTSILFRSTGRIWQSIDIYNVKEEEESANRQVSNNNITRIDLSVKEVDFPTEVPPHFARFKGSCDGIICIIDLYFVYLWNPTIKQYKRLAPLLDHCWDDAYGIGYDTSVDDYKVLSAHSVLLSENYSGLSVRVLALKSNSWKTIQGNFPYTISREERSIFTDGGGIHWMARRVFTREVVILCFDVVAEKFMEVPSPDIVDMNRFTNELHLLRGNLCLVPFPSANRSNLGDTKFDVWVMKEYGVRESWTKLFTFPGYNQYGSGLSQWHPRCCLAETGVFLLEWMSNKLVLCNLRNGSFRTPFSVTISSHIWMIPFVESLVSPIHGSKT